MLLNQPTRVLRDIAAVSTANYWADRVLPNGGGVSGGGVIFDIAQPGDSYSGRGPEPVAPGSEFPIVNSAEGIPGSATVAKWGSKIKVTDEKRDRNDVRYVQREQVRAANSLVRQLHRNAVAAIDAAVTAYSRTTTWTTAFSSVVNVGTTQTAYYSRPSGDVQKAQALADSLDYEVAYDTLLVNSIDYGKLLSVYPVEMGGVDRGIFPEGNGQVIPTNLIAAGTSYLIASNEAGETRFEKPLSVEIIPDRPIQTTWIQLDARAVYFVDNPYAVLKFTGG
jgi:hypothetical protein